MWLAVHLNALSLYFPAEPHGLYPALALCFDRSLECNEIAASICFLAAGLVSYSDFDNQSIFACKPGHFFISDLHRILDLPTFFPASSLPRSFSQVLNRLISKRS
jgi:hypothetical protein